ncbi:hypothetical protein F5Y16DRAFT_355304 [Xylariaceae sp. FL0255]|nr:hypothetical protein F5Y16DRAFT_355304 [Xylariaceae sp. FL0255]
MATIQPQHINNPFHIPKDDSRDDSKDEWEDWEMDSDDSPNSPRHESLLIDLGDNTQPKPSSKQPNARNTQHRPVQLPRVKSRARQKAQNAKAGIKLVTDMSQFRHPSTQLRSAESKAKGKFVDSAALLALEGNPSTPSIGSFAWLKKKPGNMRSKKSLRPGADDLSPEARPIVIGISVPSDDAGSHQVSPQTAVIETPMDVRGFYRKPGNKNGVSPSLQQQLSVWSPDTEASESPYNGARPASSIYAQITGHDGSNVTPPVPTLPAAIRFMQNSSLRDHDEDENDSPCTLFEEDGSPVANRKSQKLKAKTTSPESAGSRSHGWWDHVMTPFTPQSNNPFKAQAQETQATGSSSQTQEWWSGQNEKAGASSKASHLTISTSTPPQNQDDVISKVAQSESRDETHTEKSRALADESHHTDAPPPYEPPKSHHNSKGALPQSYISTQPIPSPGPMTPGLPGTMTSQGSINLSDIPLTPSLRPAPNAVLPDRLAGTFNPGDHFYDAPGTRNKTERKRRRHEKEDVIARKMGGFWRGRGLIPEEGCFGRSGREGRKRRRICLGILGGLIAAIILIVVLTVVLTKRALTTAPAAAQATATATKSPQSDVATYWLNLTDFPPMPTGVLTVAGPSNSIAISGCTVDGTPSTAWSCDLPKGDQNSAYDPNQPEFIFQVQFDNETSALWKLYNEANESGNSTDFLTDAGFTPDPSPPSIAELRFLGNTTDHIMADLKEGEPTPFFISLLSSLDATVGANMIERRQNSISGSGGNGTDSFNLTDILPAPDLNPDGMGAPAKLFPLPVQQPVRLFDRGMPTEHYGFYSYFDKNIYMANSTGLDALDKDGGVLISDANSIVTFAQTRFLVQIWTRMANSTELIGSNSGVNVTANPSVQPGSMPYPVTVTEDIHGGNPTLKVDYSYGVLSSGEINRTAAALVTVNVGFNGSLVNGKANADPSLGGIDGGTGGCKCQWVNFQKN